jgi:hypothetical protein
VQPRFKSRGIIRRGPLGGAVGVLAITGRIAVDVRSQPFRRG